MAFPNFHGGQSENANNFLDDLEMAFLVSGRDTQEVKLRAFPLVLREDAKTWYQGLEEEEKENWEVLKGLFLTRFSRKTKIQKRFGNSLQIFVRPQWQATLPMKHNSLSYGFNGK